MLAHQIKDRLCRAIDITNYEITDRDELARIVSELPKVKLTKSDLEETRLGRLINDIRKNAVSLDKGLVKTLRSVVKAWRDMCDIKPSANTFNGHVNGNGKLLAAQDEDSVGSNSAFSSSHSSSHRFINGAESTDSRLLAVSENSKSRQGRKRKVELDTLRENLNSVLNSAAGRKVQSTQEILQNVMKANPLSCNSSPAMLNAMKANPLSCNSSPAMRHFSAGLTSRSLLTPPTKKPRLNGSNLVYMDENAVDNFDAVRLRQTVSAIQSPAINGNHSSSSSKRHLTSPPPSASQQHRRSGDNDDDDEEGYDDEDDDDASNDVPYNFDKRDHSVDDELALLYARLPKISETDVDAVKDIQFDVDDGVIVLDDEQNSPHSHKDDKDDSDDSGKDSGTESGGSEKASSTILSPCSVPGSSSKKVIDEGVMKKFTSEQWPGMNGNYDDEGVWCSYGDMCYVKPLMKNGTVVKNDDLDEMFNTDFVVLPYTNCTW